MLVVGMRGLCCCCSVDMMGCWGGGIILVDGIYTRPSLTGWGVACHVVD